jgi:acetolactate synthase-1/2/3 large subunit
MTSGGLGTMGYGLPAAIGVQIEASDALVIDIAGEASILMNIQECRRRFSTAAGQDLHPQQPVYGHGAPVAGIAARRALLGELFRGAARFRETGGENCFPMIPSGRAHNDMILTAAEGRNRIAAEGRALV